MRRNKHSLICGLLLTAVLCGTGCLPRQSAVREVSAADDSLSAVSGVDSILCAEGCTGYTCYFAKGSRNKKALENIRNVVFGGFSVDVDSDDDPEYIGCYRVRLLDSLASLEWLDSEPWPAVRRLFLAWSKQQCDRFYLVSQAKRNPAILYDCPETDSVLVRCGDILSKGGAGYVAAVRRILKESEYAKSARDSVVFDKSYLEITLSQIDRELGVPDSTANARDRLFMLVSNHINRKIHDRLGKNATVDFFSYSDDFLRIFDSVSVETEEP